MFRSRAADSLSYKTHNTPKYNTPEPMCDESRFDCTTGVKVGIAIGSNEKKHDNYKAFKTSSKIFSNHNE